MAYRETISFTSSGANVLIYTDVFNSQILQRWLIGIQSSAFLFRIHHSNPELNRYIYHSDHLGSSAFLTDALGTPTQHLQYLPFGENFIEQRTTTDYYSPYTFSAKERDTETGYSYFGARYYDPNVSVWLSVDPMSDERSWLSPYNYCQWKPMGRVDLTGALDWEPDKNGNLVAEKGDNAITLSECLGVSYDEANEIYSDLSNWDKRDNAYAIAEIKGHILHIDAIPLKIGNMAAYFEGANAWSLYKKREDFNIGDYKCNLFVYEIALASGSNPGRPNQAGWIGRNILNHGPYPPTAGQWGDPNYHIPGWKVLKQGETPKRGDVISIPHQTLNASGHVGIVLKRGETISAGETEVLINNWSFRSGQAPIIRRWNGN